MSRLVRVELLKLFSTRLWWGLLIGVVLTSVGMGVLFAAIAGLNADGDASGAPALGDPGTLRNAYTGGLAFAYLFTLSLGIMTMSGEYRHQTMSATVLAVPRRWRIVVAKVVALVTIGVGYGIVTVVASVAGAAPVFAARGADVWRADADLPRALLLAVLAVALWALIGLGVGTLIKNQVVALLVAIGVAWIAEPLLGFALNQLDLGSIARFLPTAATSALTEPAQATGAAEVSLLPVWGGVVVLLGYAAVSAGVGAASTLRRDIT